MNEQSKALALSKRALELLDEELARSSQGLDAASTLPQLENCQRQLRGMVVQLESKQLPPKNQRLHGMGHMIADSWPIHSELGEALLRAEHAYRAAT